MYDSFFDGLSTRPVTIGTDRLTLPLIVSNATLIAAAFSVSDAAVRAELPTRRLAPVRIDAGRAVLFLVAWEYRDLEIGGCNEVLISFPVVYGRGRAFPALPAVLRRVWPGYGVFAKYVPVTSRLAETAGHEIWRLPKLVARVDYEESTGERACTVSEGEKDILRLSVSKPGGQRRLDEFDRIFSWDRQANQVWESVVRVRGVGARSRKRSSGALRLGSHPIADSLRALGIGADPLETRYYPFVQMIRHEPRRKRSG